MLQLVRPIAAAPAEPAHEPFDELLDRLGLSAALPDRLALDAEGRPFEPAQIDQAGDLLAHFTLLLRREPFGGAEQQIRDNERAARDAIVAGLNEALARRSDAPRTLLAGLIAAVRARKEAVDDEQRELEQRLAALQARLHAWQDRAGKAGDTLGAGLWRWLVGGADRMSLPEAVAHWNEREHLAVRRAAVSAAQACFAEAGGSLVRLLDQLDARIDEVRRLALGFAEERAQRGQRDAVYTPWSLRLDEELVAAALAGRADAERALAELLRRLAGEGELDLAAEMRAVALAAADRLLAGLSIADLVALETEVAAEPGQDGLVVVGQTLLETVSRPTWQLTRRARPRIETVQITPDGAPIFSLEGLGSAAYGDGLDRMGFVQVQLAVALAELALVAESEELFAATLAQRNLYLVDELALAAAPAALVGPGRALARSGAIAEGEA